MPETGDIDFYEVLQVSPRADRETIDRVFRHLAHRYHPDNLESGDSGRFVEVVNAHTVLTDEMQRARYDARYEDRRQQRWRIFNQDTAQSEVASDIRIRLAILSLLYVARRNNLREPGLGIIEFERVLGCPTGTLEFHLWYLRENGWVAKTESGHTAITACGVDKFFELGGPPQRGPHLLQTNTTEPVEMEGAA